MTFKRTKTEEAWSGEMFKVRVDTVRFDDNGEEAEREIAEHPGAVAVFAHDGESFYLVAQPREAVGAQRLVELPAGKLDEEGEEPLDTAKRELAEEIGKGARTWEHLATFWTSPGFSNERVLIYMATDLFDSQAEAEEHERINVLCRPLSELDEAIAECSDSKSLIGMLWFKAYKS
ncbi:MAG: NUDIX hydrolase [Thermoleophilaceae bacterium]|nr:NUDIX hydrolase [Thermoleophilaceae bacterium]